MIKRSGAVLGLLLALGYCAVYASDASASGHLVSLKACDHVLNAADFEDDLEEVSPSTLTHGKGFEAETSTCKYAALTEAAGGAPKSFSNGGLGVECLYNVVRLAGEEKVAPLGGCYRIVTTSLIVTTGPQVAKLLPTLRKGYKDKIWPSTYPRFIAHGIGNRAEFGYDGEKGYAYLQVLNAQIDIETTGSLSLLQLLRKADDLL